MLWRSSDVVYLRKEAAQFRQLASLCEITVAARLLEVAIELEAKAAEIDAPHII